jgi:hypothetical protein
VAWFDAAWFIYLLVEMVCFKVLDGRLQEVEGQHILEACEASLLGKSSWQVFSLTFRQETRPLLYTL